MTTPDEVKRRIFEAIGAYSVGVSQTGICAPTVEMVAEIESAIDALAAQAAPAQPLVNDTFAVDWLTNRAELHPLTANLVVRFARALAAKLAAAEKKYGYTDGWRDQNWMDECRAKLVEHIAKGDPRDVAAYCAFLWHHGESTAGAQAAPAAQPSSEFERGRQLGIEQERALWELAAQSQELGLYHDAALQAAQPVAWMARYTKRGKVYVYVTTDHALAVENDDLGNPQRLYASPQADTQPSEPAKSQE